MDGHGVRHKRIVIGDQIKAIGKGAFCRYLTSVKTVTVGKKCKSIGPYAFEGCEKLTTVYMKNSRVKTIGSGVKTLRGMAFANCSALKTVTFKGAALTTNGTKVFDGVTATVKYPASRKKSWTKSVRSKLKKNAKLKFKTY